MRGGPRFAIRPRRLVRMAGFLTTPTPRELSLPNLGKKKYLLRPATLENYLCENTARVAPVVASATPGIAPHHAGDRRASVWAPFPLPRRADCSRLLHGSADVPGLGASVGWHWLTSCCDVEPQVCELNHSYAAPICLRWHWMCAMYNDMQ